MVSSPLLICDFDGVIVDGMQEYWFSSRKACFKLIGKRENSQLLTEQIPEDFRFLRAWVKQGWEMVLLAAELSRPNSLLVRQGATAFSKNYQLHRQQALEAWNWKPSELQQALEMVRQEEIIRDKEHWLAMHIAYPGIIERLKQLKNEGIELGVLTTKSAEFTATILKAFDLQPSLLYGHESGNKPEVLLELLVNRSIQGFVEDRRATLVKVLNTSGLEFLPCYLASWGYLKPEDKTNLPQGIQLLKPETLATPLATWH